MFRGRGRGLAAGTRCPGVERAAHGRTEGLTRIFLIPGDYVAWRNSRHDLRFGNTNRRLWTALLIEGSNTLEQISLRFYLAINGSQTSIVLSQNF